jgi:glycosyltransferase involved in cell wall biosynthesis
MNPRVLMLTTYFRPIVGGVESNAERLARYLENDGFPARVLTKRVTRTLSDTETLGRVRVDRIGPFGERTGAGKWRLLPHAILWLIRHRADYDVVCVVDYRGIGIAAIIGRAFTGRRVVVQAQTTGVLSGSNADAAFRGYGVAPGGPIGRVLKWPVLAAYRSADAFACISRDIERETQAAGIPQDRIHYLPNAIDMAQFHPPDASEREAKRQACNIPAGFVVCLYVGRLSREKGLMELMEAWNRIRPANALLLVAGPDMVGHDWNVGPEAREFVERNGLTGSVRFLGSTTDVASLLRVADVFIQPSHFEALGLSAIEALATGVPVVSSGVGGLLDFIVDGENGTLVPPQDPPALAGAIQALIADPALRQRFAGRARASVLGEYDERVVFSRFGALLRQLAEAHR